MYVGTACFDPSSLQQEGLTQPEDGFSQTHVPNCNTSFSMEEQTYPQSLNPSQQDATIAAAAVLEMELQQQLRIEMEHCHSNNMQGGSHLVQDIVHESVNWQDMSNGNFNNDGQYQHMQQGNDVQNGHHQGYIPVSLPETSYSAPPDLLNMFPLPRCSASSLLPNSSISFANSAQKSPNFLASLGLYGDLNPMATDSASASAGVVYDPLLPLNLPPQPPLLRDLFHSLPHSGYAALGGPRSGSLFGGVDERDMNSGLYQDGDETQFENGVFEFTADMNCIGKGRNGKDTKHFTSERQRRMNFNDKYQALRSLVPNPTKNDRATIVADAIEYINELKRTVTELRVLVEKKRCSRERMKRQRTEPDDGTDQKPACGDMEHSFDGSSLRSSWLHRKSKNTEVDVRIVDDEVTVKLVQQKRINCLLFVSRVLDELQLDLHHVAGGLIGDYYSFLFNSKICEGSIVYASAIANKLIEVVDKQYAAITPTTSY